MFVVEFILVNLYTCDRRIFAKLITFLEPYCIEFASSQRWLARFSLVLGFSDNSDNLAPDLLQRKSHIKKMPM